MNFDIFLKVSDLSLDEIKTRFAPYRKKIEEMKMQAETFEVKDEATAKHAVAMAGDARRLFNTLEKKRKNIVEKPNRFVKALNNFVREFSKPLKEIEADLKAKIGEYQYKLELERRKQEEAIKKANEELQEKLEIEARKSGVEAPKVAPMPIPKKDMVARADTGASAHMRKVWKAEIVNPDEIPRKYLIPDIRKINEAVKMGVREIPGVRIYEDIQTILRT